MKIFLGLALAFAIGFACRAFAIPSPAPPVLVGALLVVAMTIGYLTVDRARRTPAKHAIDCGGPSGLAPSASAAEESGRDRPGAAWTAWIERAACAVQPLLDSRAVRFVALLALCAAYLQGGLVKLTDFGGAVAEARHFGFPWPSLVAIATILTELGASALILTGIHRWIGALWLAGFTLAATFVANRFWELPLPDRFMVENAFFEHLGLVGAFVLVAWYDLRHRRTTSREPRSDRAAEGE